ncbi:hypothetical protein N9Y92_01620 [Chlamydiales bacterium]|nr:hypothetical protein [Chlamydiales bacterium]
MFSFEFNSIPIGENENITYHYHEDEGMIEERVSFLDEIIFSKKFPINENSISTSDNTLFNSYFDWISPFWDTQTSQFNQYSEALESISHHIIGEFNLFLWGIYPELTETGTVGNGEFSPKIRISAINGILNNQINGQDLAIMISDLHGGQNVHYTYWPSEGYTRDLFHTFLCRTGYISDTSKKIANTWRKLIDEMGGLNGEGTIIHYAHSVGAQETSCAISLMSDQELKKIKIITFGSPYLFENDTLLEVTHYVSKRDGISMILDPFTYTEAAIKGLPHVYFVGDHAGPPLIDHLLIYGTYLDILTEIGIQFQKDYPNL